MKEMIGDMFKRRAAMWQDLIDSSLISSIALAAETIIVALKDGHKILIFGNGGSAAEAQHFAAELVCQFERARKALPAIALTVDSSILTAQANDFGYQSVFARQIEALCKPGDIVVGMTTSDAQGDHSANLRQALIATRAAGGISILFCSQKTHELLALSDLVLVVPDPNTARIQEVHLAIVHIISGLIEEALP